MSNPRTIYNTSVRASGPAIGIIWDADRGRYIYDNITTKPWTTYTNAFWYKRYLAKFGYVGYSANGVLPSVIADFANDYYVDNAGNTAFDDMSTFTRASTATYFDSTGTLQTASSGVARRNSYVYNGTSWVNRGIFLESEARTNVFRNSTWTGFTTGTGGQTQGGVTKAAGAFGITVEVESIGTEDGIPYMQIRVYGTESGGSARFFNLVDTGSVAAADGDRIATSGYFKYVSGTIPANTSIALFNHARDVSSTLIDGAGTDIGTAVAAATSMTRITYNKTLSGATITQLVNKGLYFRVGANETVDFTIRIGGMQVEAGAQPSSLIPTSGATATRAAETLTIAAANMAYDATAMSFAMDGLVTYADTGAAAEQTFFRWYVDGNDNIVIRLDTDAGTGDVVFIQEDTNVQDFVEATSALSPGINVPFSIASRHGTTFINGAVAGTAQTANTTPTALADLSATTFELGYDFMGHISQFRQFAADIGDTGIEEASA